MGGVVRSYGPFVDPPSFIFLITKGASREAQIFSTVLNSGSRSLGSKVAQGLGLDRFRDGLDGYGMWSVGS